MGLVNSLYGSWFSSRNKSTFKMVEGSLNSLGNNNLNILDIGAGNGDNLYKIGKLSKNPSLYCIEIYEPYALQCKQKGIKTYGDDLNNFPFNFNNSSFDLIYSNQVIEHLFYPKKFLEEIHRILKKGGEAIISTENLSSWDNIIALILGYLPFSMELDNGFQIGNPLNPSRKVENRSPYPPHLRILTYVSFKELCKYVGFEVLEYSGNGHILGKFGEIIDSRHSRFITIRIKKI